MQHGPIERAKFRELNLGDGFFDSLRADYAEFDDWFERKALEEAWVVRNDSGALCGFLYTKVENEALADVSPPRPAARRIKAGTLKVDAHGTRLGERFIKLLLDQAFEEGAQEVYVTVFPKHKGLIAVLTQWGFESVGQKITANGTEDVLARSLRSTGRGVHKDYPLIDIHGRRSFLLGIYPEYHTRLFPDSKLRTESADIIQDVAHTNSIFKIYIAWSRMAARLKQGDLLVIYRTKDQNARSGWYSSVATSVCVLDKVLGASAFADEERFVSQCLAYSVFEEEELRGFWRKSRDRLVLLRMLYNFALPRRPNRKSLIEDVGLDADERWSVLPLTPDQFTNILRLGQADERLIVDQT